MTPTVLDASVLVKLFREETGSTEARAGIEFLAEQRIDLLAPSIALYEVLAVALHYEVPFAVPMQVLDALEATGFRFGEPTASELLTAERIAKSKSASHGHPDLEDSIYHAMAIGRGGTFVTADQRHFAKAKQFGSIVLLADWRPAGAPTPRRP